MGGDRAEHLPAEFVLAGWQPELWRPEDLLNRTDAFVASANARSEVFRARLIAASGTRVADALLPSGSAGSNSIPRGLDVKAISFVISDQLRRVGTGTLFPAWPHPSRASVSRRTRRTLVNHRRATVPAGTVRRSAAATRGR